MPVFLGLDGGGSTLRALAIDEAGQVVFRGQSGAANLISTPQPYIEAHLERALVGCPDVVTIWGAFAGAIDDETRSRAEIPLRKRFPNAQIVIGSDAEAAFHSCPEGTRMAVIAGTGSLICSGPVPFLSSGGGGWMFGDEGSAYRYGLAALKEYFRYEPTPRMRAAIEALWSETDLFEIYGDMARIPKIASLLEPFAADLNEGVPYAVEALETECAQLGRLVREHAEKHLTDAERPIMTGLMGGVWSASPQFVDALRAAVGPSFLCEIARTSPVDGAARMARRLGTGE